MMKDIRDMNDAANGEEVPFQPLQEQELLHLGEFARELIVRVGNRYLPPALKDAAWFSTTWSQTNIDYLALGRRIYDLYISTGKDHRLPPFQEKTLFWNALAEAISFLLNERKMRNIRGAFIVKDKTDDEASLRPIDIDEVAQEIIDGAFSDDLSVPSHREQHARVQFTLAIDPFCTDAYTILGVLEQRKGNYQQARLAYERAMKIAALHIGPEVIISANVRKERDVLFWSDLGTRAYMRPKAALAYLFWKKFGDFKQAIAHFQGLIDLDPNDHQGNRYALLCCLLEDGDDEALTSALARHRLYTSEEREAEDITDTCWHYTNACRLFRIASHTNDDSFQQARTALYRAFQKNPYVPQILLSARELPEDSANLSHAAGSLEEAIWYAEMSLGAWRNTPGALEWLQAAATQI